MALAEAATPVRHRVLRELDPISPEPGFFYSVTCHGPLVSRRQLLVGGAALAAAAAGSPGQAVALEDGTTIVRRYASRPDDPWMVCHGIRGMGRDFAVEGGRRAVDYLLETQLVLVPAGEGRVLGFPRAVEVHPNMFLKTMLEAGVPLDHGFVHEGRPRTLREVLEGARALFRPSQVGAAANMLPWSVIAFSRTTSPLRRQWTNAWGEPVDLDRVVEVGLRLLEQGSLPLMQVMREGGRVSPRAPVHSFTCGGTHLLYALLVAMRTGYTGSDRLDRTRRQVDLLVWRMRADLELMDRFFAQRAGQPGRYWFELDARLKLLGHAQECLAFGAQNGVIELSASQEAQRQAAVVALRRMIEEMEQRDMSEARDLDRDLFRQLVGDACHARRGLTLA